MARIQVSRVIEAPRSKVFELLTNPSHLPDLLRGDLYVEILNAEERLSVGSEVRLAMTRMGVRQVAHLRVDDYLHSKRLLYHQIEGFFKSWSHSMKFEDHGDGYTLVTDFVDYALPLGLLGNLADDLFAKRDLSRILENRLSRVDMLL